MILIDYRDRRPIYEQVAEKLADLMVRGILPQDSQLPSVRSLALELAVNPNTIQRAYAELERRGCIYSVKGKGSFVAESHRILEHKRRAVFKCLEELVEAARAAGISMPEFQGEVARLYGTEGQAEEAEGGRDYD